MCATAAPRSPKQIVSLLSPSGLVLALGPHGAAAAIAGGNGSRGPQPQRFAADPADGDSPELAARGLARRALSTFKGKARRVSLILSSHFVRQMLVPWSLELSGDEEEVAALRHHFRRIHGEAALGWTLCYSIPAGGTTCIGCAIEPKFLDALREESAAQGFRLTSVQPSLAVNFNRWRGLFGTQAGLFLLVEEDRYACAQFRSGGWSALTCGRLGPDLGLEGLVARQLGLAADEPPAFGIWLRMPGAARQADFDVEGATVRILRPDAAQLEAALEDAAFTGQAG